MKTRKLLFTMIAAMTMVFGLTLTAHAEEAPATKVVGVEGIGTFTVPADWTEEYIEGYGTYWFNPTKTASVMLSVCDRTGKGLAPIDAYADVYKKNVEATGVSIIDWQVTKYLEHDAVYEVVLCPGNSDFSVDYQVLNTAAYSCGYDYYVDNCIVGNCVAATTVDELQAVMPILATYQPAK